MDASEDRSPQEIPSFAPLQQASRWRLVSRVLRTPLALTLLIVAVVLSPLLLPLLEGSTTADWTRLSEIGQTYGAASALLSALAVVGVSATLFVQNRQARAQQFHQMHALHGELVRLELANPKLYTPCWGHPNDILDEAELRQHLYIVLMLNFAWMSFEIGSMSEPMLTDMLRKMFRGEPGRRYWRTEREVWFAVSGGTRRGKEFIAIADREYVQATPSAPAVSSARE